MSSSIQWPLGCFLLGPYAVDPRSANVESDHPMVPAAARVYAENNERHRCEMVLTPSQEQALRSFFKTTTAMGTQSFLVPVLVDGVVTTCEAQFFGAPPSYVPLSNSLVRATFDLLVWPVQQDPHVETDYDSIVLARDPSAYWRLDETSGSSFTDLTGHGNTLAYSGSGIVYSQGDLLTDPGGSIGNDGGNNFQMRVAIGNGSSGFIGPDSFTVAGWVKLENVGPTADKYFFHIGGSGGAAQVTKCRMYRNASGGITVQWHVSDFPNPDVLHTDSFATTSLPLDTPFYFSAGQDHANTRFFFKVNDQSPEYLSYGSDSPHQIPGRTTYFYWGNQAGITAGRQLVGDFARLELYDLALTNLDMWTDWHL